MTGGTVREAAALFTGAGIMDYFHSENDIVGSATNCKEC